MPTNFDILRNEWEGVSGDDIQTAFKQQFGTSAGYFPPMIKEDEYYYQLYFRNKVEYDAWALMSPEQQALGENPLLLAKVKVPISTSQGDSYSARIYTSLNVTNRISLTTKTLYIPLRFNAIKNSDGEKINAGVPGKLYIQRSTDGSNWTTVSTTTIQSRDPEYTGYDNVNIGSFIQEGIQQIRFYATFDYIDSENNAKIAVSPYIIFTEILYSEMKLTFSAQWQRPFTGGRAELGFFIQGYGTMALYVKCDNSFVVNGTNVQTTTEVPYSVVIENTDANPSRLTNGIHTITAWLEAPGGVGQQQTEMQAKFLYFDEESATDAEKNATYVLVNNLVSTLHPYIEGKILEYAVYKHNADTVPLTMLFTNSTRATTYISHDLGNVPCGQVHNYVNALKLPSNISSAYLYFKVGETVQTSQYWSLPVDQTINYTPTSMNSSGFILDPSVRSNNETHPEKIINANTGNEVTAVWSDNMQFNSPYGYAADENGITRLHIPAGRSVHITGYDPFDEFLNNNTASLTMEFDVKISNVYDESEKVISAGSLLQGRILGFLMKPMTAYFLTAQQAAVGAQDVHFQEDERTHITVNIINNLGSRNLNFVRIFINGIINREFIYGNTDSFVSVEGSEGIRIGSSSADIDIYGIRIYKQALSSHQIMQDYKSSISDSAKKLNFHRKNDILGGDNTVSYEKAKELYSTMLMLPDDYSKPYIPNYANGSNASYSKCTLKVIFRYRYTGNGHNAGDINYDLSRVYTHMKVKGQGTSSMTYWTWNIRFEFTGSSQVYAVGSDLEAGELLLSNVDLDEDDWECYGIFEEGGAKCYKLDAKANWASSSQSHKMGMMNAYGALWKEIIGTSSPIYAADSKTRPCVLQEAFLFFVKDENANINFSNFMTFGPAKNDKGTWGTKVKSSHYKKNGEDASMYTMLEGSSNGRPLPEGKVPWIREEVFYYYNTADDNDSKNETFVYNDDAQFDFDKGPTNVQNEGESNEFETPKGFTQVGTSPLWQETTDYEYDSTDIYKVVGGNTIKFYRRAWNLIYRCNPNLIAVEGDCFIVFCCDFNGNRVAVTIAEIYALPCFNLICPRCFGNFNRENRIRVYVAVCFFRHKMNINNFTNQINITFEMY